MELDRKLFEMINSYPVPDFVTDLAVYLHGYRHVEVTFFLFCLFLGAVLIASPKKGIRASLAAFVAAMLSFFGAQHLNSLFKRPFPYLDETLSCQLRVEALTSFSAFPLTSVVTVCAVSVALIYYFPKYSMLVVLGSVVYTLMPIHLGVAFPTDALGSMALGYALSYVLMNFMGKKAYFKRF